MSIKALNISEILETVNLFVFDFDGVIADSIDVKTKAFQDMYIEYGEKISQMVVSHHLANGGMSRFEKFKLYHKDFLGIDISEEDLKILSTKFGNLVKQKVIDSNEIAGVNSFLEYLCVCNKTSIINSATPKTELLEIVSGRNLTKYFSEIYGSPSSKKENLELAMNKFNVSNKEILFIGDAEADLKAASELNVQFLGIGTDILRILLESNKEYFYLENFKKILDS